MSTTFAVTATLYSYEDGVFMSSRSDPSIITLVNPEWIEAWQTMIASVSFLRDLAP